MILNIPVHLWCHMQYLAREPEIGAMGIIDQYRDGKEAILKELHVTRQEVTSSSVDMELIDWTEQSLIRGQAEGIAPWQWHFWFHSHPAGYNKFSGTDIATLNDPIGMGSWQWLMATILTKSGHFYGEMISRHQPIVGEMVSSVTQVTPKVLWAGTRIAPSKWQREIDANVSRIISKTSFQEGDTPWWNPLNHKPASTTSATAVSSAKKDSKESEPLSSAVAQ